MLSVIWTVFLCMALLCGAVTGRLAEVTAAVPTGASEAITLAISITGLMCFWSGVMELLQASGLAERLSHLMDLFCVLCSEAHRRINRRWKQ